MKTMMKTLTAVAVLALVGFGAAWAADDVTVPPGTPGWRHAQMVKAMQDGTFTPGRGPGLGRGMMMRAGYGPGMAAAIGPDGKIDPSKLPPDCPYGQSQAKD